MAAVRCSKCNALYPSDMDACPSCGYSPSGKHVNLCTTPDPMPTTLNPRTIPVGRAPKPVNIRANSNPIQTYATPNLIPCTACNGQISPQAEVCPHCGQPTGVHVCPKCGKTNTKVISGASKVTSILLWGPFAANKVVSKYQCNECGHKF